MQLYKVTLAQEMADNNPLSISYIFNGKPELSELVASKPAEEIKAPNSQTCSKRT